MRPSTFALPALASFAAVTAESITFSAVSSDKSINAPISSIHEGAGLNYFLVAEGGSGEKFDLENGVATTKQGQYTANVGVSGRYFAAGPAVSPSTLDFSGDVVENYNFFACKNTGDPYSYSARSYIIAVNEKGDNNAPFEECTPVSIVKVAAAEAPSTSTSTGPSYTSSSIPSGWRNETVTTGHTVTGYTTYCPEPTTVTITTCVDHECGPTTITVSEATTITITGECVVPTVEVSPTPVPPVHTSSAPKANPSHPTSVTVTNYTIDCPEPTVLTITTCSDNKCAPMTTTVSEATTLTVSGECVIQATVAPAVTSAKASSAVSTLVTESAESSSAPAAVSTFHNGAGKAAAGAVGLVGAIALFI